MGDVEFGWSATSTNVGRGVGEKGRGDGDEGVRNFVEHDESSPGPPLLEGVPPEVTTHGRDAGLSLPSGVDEPCGFVLDGIQLGS